jgi:hypothetical protein
MTPVEYAKKIYFRTPQLTQLLPDADRKHVHTPARPRLAMRHANYCCQRVYRSGWNRAACPIFVNT